ncbi:heme-binding protein [Phycicoccus sp. BSK3Z-2]|uniref:Heme-binding protein n=1 Tax=Phycicoccus avicenniae TaxID=2828860 RepID=A0A941D7X8_9MICO|nr:heme-binding protein [Phycicoccus avicenniae]MBR7743759.1 heme-binding protein [Phycicoccus avicenniae]
MKNAPPPPTLSAQAARRVVDAAFAEAERLGTHVVVWVLDPDGHDVAMVRMDRSPPEARQVARDRAWSAVAFGQPTTWWRSIVDDDPTHDAVTRGDRLSPVGGGVPLRIGGTVVGGLGVAGGTGDEDEGVADAGAAAVDGS